MAKKPDNQGEQRPSTESRKIQNERFIVNDSDDIALNRQLPTGGQKHNIEIMQRTVTPPNPNGGNTPTKK